LRKEDREWGCLYHLSGENRGGLQPNAKATDRKEQASIPGGEEKDCEEKELEIGQKLR